jgi:hypothetical protein
MSVKEFSPDIATQLASEDFYNLRRNAIGQNTKAKIFQL